MEIIEEQRTKPRQAPGQLLSIAGLGLLTGALVEVGRTGWSAPRTVGHWPSVTGRRSLAVGHWPSVTGRRSLAVGHWP